MGKPEGGPDERFAALVVLRGGIWDPPSTGTERETGKELVRLGTGIAREGVVLKGMELLVLGCLRRASLPEGREASVITLERSVLEAGAGEAESSKNGSKGLEIVDL